MKPPKNENIKYERVPKYDEWLPTVIENIEYNPAYKKVVKGDELVYPAVRFKLKIEGCTYCRYSHWLRFSYNDKANLYKTFISTLVEGARPKMDLDLDVLKGMSIKTMWAQNGEYDNLTMVRPASGKITAAAVIEQVPF